MLGICVAVKATTSTSGCCFQYTLKLWKSLPAAPMMRTRVVLGGVMTALRYGRGVLREKPGDSRGGRRRRPNAVRRADTAIDRMPRVPGSAPAVSCLGGERWRERKT